MGRGATEDAALAERERRSGWVADGDYAALVPCAADEGWIGGEGFNGGLGGGGFHCWVSFLFTSTACLSNLTREIAGREGAVGNILRVPRKRNSTRG